MNKLLSLLLITAALVGIIPASALAKGTVQILPDIKKHFTAELVEDVKTGQEWFAIVKTGNAYKARKVTVSVTSESDNEADKSSVSLLKRPKPKIITPFPLYSDVIFYVRGLKLEEGQMITAATIDGKNFDKAVSIYDLSRVGDEISSFSDLGKAASFNFAKDSYHIQSEPGKTHSPYKLMLSRNGKTNMLMESHISVMSWLEWAGDLNNDGFADVLVSDKMSYILYLSNFDGVDVIYSDGANRSFDFVD